MLHDPTASDLGTTLQAIVRDLPTLAFVYDVRAGRSLYENRPLPAFLGHASNASLDEAWRTLMHPDDVERFAAWREQRGAMADGTEHTIEYRMRHADGSWRCLLGRDRPFRRDADGTLRLIIGSTADITEQKAIEETLREHELMQSLLIGELNHRVSNTLATVQALAYQTHLSTETPLAFHEQLTVKLRALDEAHRLLAREQWEGAPFADLARAALAPFAGAPEEGRYTLQGPPLRVGAAKAVSVMMLLHELATNAVRHGAWRSATGRVALTWSIAPDARSIALAWVEEGDPLIAADPERRGFGSQLIERVLVRELHGSCVVERRTTGLAVRAVLPLSTHLALG